MSPRPRLPSRPEPFRSDTLGTLYPRESDPSELRRASHEQARKIEQSVATHMATNDRLLALEDGVKELKVDIAAVKTEVTKQSASNKTLIGALAILLSLITIGLGLLNYLKK